MTGPTKPRRGRPPIAAEDRRDVRVELKLTESEYGAWLTSAAGRPLSTWVVDTVNRVALDDDPDARLADRREHLTVGRLVVGREDGEWRWTAYDVKGRFASLGVIEQGLRETIEDAARRHAEENGLLVSEDLLVEQEVERRAPIHKPVTLPTTKVDASKVSSVRGKPRPFGG